MKCLNLEERKQLLKILEDYFTARPLQYLHSLISNSGVEGEFNINFNVSTPEFVEILYAELSNTYTHGSERRLNLVVFLEYFTSKLAPDADEQFFIKDIIKKWEFSQSSEYEPRRNNYMSLLAKARQEQSQPLLKSLGLKFDKEVIVGYDLESIEAKFKERLDYEGSCAFAISGSYQILKEYIIERILRDMRNKTERPCRPPIHIRLYASDISIGTQAIEYKLKSCNQCRKNVDLFYPESCLDIVLVVWNYEIPKESMEWIATDFWNKKCIELSPLLINKSRCFIVIFANLAFDSPMELDGFTNLIIPSKFETSKLIPWFRGRLKQLELEDYIINQYLTRLEIEQENLMGTYHVMQEIIDEIQGKIL